MLSSQPSKMSELLEQYEASKKKLRTIDALKRLPILYHPDSILRSARDGRVYRTGVFRDCADVVPSQPSADVSLLKIDAVVAEGAAVHEARAIRARLLEYYRAIPTLELPSPSAKNGSAA